MTKLTIVAAALLAAGCAATPPSGPSILVLPGSSKNFDKFRSDDMECRGYAYNQLDDTSIGSTSPDLISGARGNIADWG